MCVAERTAEGFDRAFGYAEFEKDCFTIRSINQDLRYEPLAIVLRGCKRANCGSTTRIAAASAGPSGSDIIHWPAAARRNHPRPVHTTSATGAITANSTNALRESFTER